MTFLVIVTTRTLSAFPLDRLSYVLVNSAAKDIETFIRVPLWMVSPSPPQPPASLVTPLHSVIVSRCESCRRNRIIVALKCLVFNQT